MYKTSSFLQIIYVVKFHFIKKHSIVSIRKESNEALDQYLQV